MTRIKQANEKAKEAVIAWDYRWSDPEYRRRVWRIMNPIERLMLLRQMEEVANEDLETPYPLETTEEAKKQDTV